MLVALFGCQEPGANWVMTATSTGAAAPTATDGMSAGSTNTPTSSGTSNAADTAGATTDSATATGAAADATISTSAGGATSSSVGTTGATASAGGTTSDAGGDTLTTGGASTTGSSQASLISNGGFSLGEADWSFTGNGTVNAASGEYCVTLTADGEVQIGWPDGGSAASVTNGVSYRLSYQAYHSGGSAPAASTKVGQAFDPYAPFVEQDITLTTSPMTYTHDFTMSADDQAGVLFRVTGTNGDRVCYDNVELVAR